MYSGSYRKKLSSTKTDAFLRVFLHRIFRMNMIIRVFMFKNVQNFDMRMNSNDCINTVQIQFSVIYNRSSLIDSEVMGQKYSVGVPD